METMPDGSTTAANMIVAALIVEYEPENLSVEQEVGV
jgi:hypothetical protein